MALTVQACEATETYQGWVVSVTGKSGQFAASASYAGVSYEVSGFTSLAAAQAAVEGYIDSTTPDGCLATAYGIVGTSSTLVRSDDGTWSVMADGKMVANEQATAREALAKLPAQAVTA
jgi:hypothetical protein